MPFILLTQKFEVFYTNFHFVELLHKIILLYKFSTMWINILMMLVISFWQSVRKTQTLFLFLRYKETREIHNNLGTVKV